MTAPADPIVEIHVRVPLRASDRDYIVGAVGERVVAARARGEHYAFPDFIRDALIEAAHR